MGLSWGSVWFREGETKVEKKPQTRKPETEGFVANVYGLKFLSVALTPENATLSESYDSHRFHVIKAGVATLNPKR